MLFPIEIPESERTPLVKWLLNLVAEQKLVVKNQQQVIENQQDTIAELERKVQGNRILIEFPNDRHLTENLTAWCQLAKSKSARIDGSCPPWH